VSGQGNRVYESVTTVSPSSDEVAKPVKTVLVTGTLDYTAHE